MAGETSDGASTPSFDDMLRQWREMADAAARPWQEAANAFAEPWREMAESFTSRAAAPDVGQEAWDRLTGAFTELAGQQQRIAEAIFEAMRTQAEQMQQAMQQAVDQVTAFARGEGSPET